MSTKSVEISRPIRAAQILFFINGAIWLLFGVVSFYRMFTGDHVYPITMFVIACLMFGNMAAMLVAGFTIGRSRKKWFSLAMLILLTNIFLSFTDQVGLFDLVALLIDLLILSLLIANRDWYGL